MDNLTHSLAGLAVGELAHRCLPQEKNEQQQAVRHRLLLLSCALASNFPDLDLVLSGLLPEPLGYLLHHRGHTHTILYALPQALLLAILILLPWPAARRLLTHSRAAAAGFLLTTAGGLLLHLMMDYLNSYGIHPFHPFDSRWYFGDLVFIIEPFFWIAFGIPLAMAVQARGWRTLFAGGLCAMVLYFTVRGYLLWTSFAVLMTVAAVLGLVQKRAGRRGCEGMLLALFASLLFVGIQSYASDAARRTVTAHLHSLESGTKVVDVALTSFPSNSLCWMFASVERNGENFRVRRGIVTVAPLLLSVPHCPAPLAGLSPQIGADNAVAMLSVQNGDLNVVRRLYRDNCYFNAWLRFARVPAVQGNRATDIRFSSTEQGNFTTIDLDAFPDDACPAHVPQWAHPRADILQQSGGAQP